MTKPMEDSRCEVSRPRQQATTAMVDGILKKLSHRKWEEVRASWLRVIDPLSDLDQVPEHPVESNVALQQHLDPWRENERSISVEIPNFRSDLFREGLVLYYKGIHVGSDAVRLMQDGYATWGQVTSYQATLYLIRALLAFLGVIIVRNGNTSYLVDIWNVPGKGSETKKRGIGREEIPSTIEIFYLKRQPIQHFEMWKVLRRLMRTLHSPKSRMRLWEFLKGYNDKEMALQRNRIVYNNIYWEWPDLFSAHTPNGGYVIDPTSESGLVDDEKNYSFNLLLLSAGEVHLLLESIADRAPPLKAVLEKHVGKRPDRRLLVSWEGVFSLAV